MLYVLFIDLFETINGYYLSVVLLHVHILYIELLEAAIVVFTSMSVRLGLGCYGEASVVIEHVICHVRKVMNIQISV